MKKLWYANGIRLAKANQITKYTEKIGESEVLAMISTKSYSKRIVSVILALVMVLAMAGVSFASERDRTVANYNVTIYKPNSQNLSMANGIIAPGTFATATTNEDGSVQVEIPIVPIYNYTAMGMFTADGYLRQITMRDAGQNGSISPSATPYNAALMTINAPNMPDGLRFKVSRSTIDLYRPGTNTPYWLMQHVYPAFDIVLTAR